MSDRLYQVTTVPADDIKPDLLIGEMATVIRALEDGAESRPFPVALDWSDFRVTFEPSQRFPNLLQITASAPVL